MASDRERPLVAWDKANPAFTVMANDPDLEKVREQFQKKNVYYLGSDQGCGCGFQREDDWLNEDQKEKESKQENQRRLHSYLATCLEDEDAVELFGCWSGDEQDSPVRMREVSLAALLEEKFFFIEKEHILVKTEANQSSQPTSTSRRG